MTTWAILDQASTIINIVDDRNGTVPVQQYVPGQLQRDIRTMPDGAWAGMQLINGQLVIPPPDPTQDIIALLRPLSSNAIARVLQTVQAASLPSSVVTSSAIVVP